jgi:hypothetical protein
MSIVESEQYYQELYNKLSAEKSFANIIKEVAKYRQPAENTEENSDDKKSKKSDKQKIQFRPYDPTDNERIAKSAIKVCCLYKLLSHLGEIQKTSRYTDPKSNNDMFVKATSLVILLSDYVNACANNLKFLLYEDYETKKAHAEMFKLLNTISQVGIISTFKKTYTLVEVIQEQNQE